MALETEIINFTLRTGIGSQTITLANASLTPKAIIFQAATTIDTSNTVWGRGLDDGTTHIGTAFGFGERFGVCLSSRQYDSNYSMSINSTDAFFGGAIVRVRGYVSAINTGSFQITVDVNLVPGMGWTATVLGGTDINCTVGNYDTSAGSGAVNLGYDPVALIKINTVDPPGNGEVAGADISYGFSTLCGPTQMGQGFECGPITSEAFSYQISGVVQQDIDYHSPTITDPVSITYITNGFFVTVSGSPLWNVGYLAIGGSAVSANLIQIIQPTSTGVQNNPILAAAPVIAFFGSTCKPVSSTGQADGNMMQGTCNSTTQQSKWAGMTAGAAFPYKRHARGAGLLVNSIILATATGVNASTLLGEASCTLSANNVALDWTTTSSNLIEIWALVLADNPNSTPCGDAIPVPCIPVPDIPTNLITAGNGVTITEF